MSPDLSTAVAVPAHIQAAASACRYDLLFGPCFSKKPESGQWEDFTADDYSPLRDDLEGEVSETYCGPVGNMLREFLDDLPSTLYVDEDGCFLGEFEPSVEFIEDDSGEDENDDGEAGFWCEPSPYYSLDRRQIVAALFGKTIADEFH